MATLGFAGIFFCVFVRKEVLAVIVIAINALVLFFSKTTIVGPILFREYHSTNLVPLIASLFILVHYSIENALVYLTKCAYISKSLHISRFLLLPGSLICSILMVAVSWEKSATGSHAALIVLQAQALTILLALNLYLDQLLQDAVIVLNIGTLAYFFQVSSLCMCFTSYTVNISNNFPIVLIALVLELLAIISMVAGIYVWFNYYRARQTVIMNMSACEREWSLAATLSLCILSSTGILLLSLSLIYPNVFSVQKMSVAVLYLNCGNIYVSFLQQEFVTKLHLSKLKVSFLTYVKKRMIYFIYFFVIVASGEIYHIKCNILLIADKLDYSVLLSIGRGSFTSLRLYCTVTNRILWVNWKHYFEKRLMKYELRWMQSP